MKKFLGILAAVMVAVISVFNHSGNYKNTAEPQYFYKPSIQKGYNITTNTDGQEELILEFYLNPNVNLNTNLDNPLTFLTINPGPYPIAIDLINYQNNTINYGTEDMSQEEEPLVFYFNSVNNGDEKFNSFSYTKDTICEKYYSNNPSQLYKNRWFEQNYYEEYVHGIRISILNNSSEDFNYTLNQDNLNIINNYIGTDLQLSPEEPNPTEMAPEYTEPETPEEPETPLTQIGSIITDTIGWFTNIFTGLSAAFYIDGELTTWGTVLFIGVAITIIAMVLKWLISLIKGV